MVGFCYMETSQLHELTLFDEYKTTLIHNQVPTSGQARQRLRLPNAAVCISYVLVSSYLLSPSRIVAGCRFCGGQGQTTEASQQPGTLCK